MRDGSLTGNRSSLNLSTIWSWFWIVRFEERNWFIVIGFDLVTHSVSNCQKHWISFICNKCKVKDNIKIFLLVQNQIRAEKLFRLYSISIGIYLTFISTSGTYFRLYQICGLVPSTYIPYLNKGNYSPYFSCWEFIFRIEAYLLYNTDLGLGDIYVSWRCGSDVIQV